MKTLWEINWHFKDSKQMEFSHCTVTPITVLREGILPGCSAPSITATSSDGHTFQGVARDYFETEVAAWAQVKQALLDTIESNEKAIEDLKAEIDTVFKFLITLH